MNTRHVQNLARLFGVLSDETRLKLLKILQKHDEKHVSDLCKMLKLPQPTVSHHLGLLRTHGLVCNRRQGKQVFYSIDPKPYNQASQAITKLMMPR